MITIQAGTTWRRRFRLVTDDGNPLPINELREVTCVYRDGRNVSFTFTIGSGINVINSADGLIEWVAQGSDLTGRNGSYRGELSFITPRGQRLKAPLVPLIVRDARQASEF